MILSMRLTEIATSLPDSQGDIADELALLARLANSMEQELEVHRLHERRRITAATMEASATSSLVELVADPDGKVLRPEFGRKT